VLTARGELDEAQQVLDEAVSIFTEKLGDKHYRTGAAVEDLGRLALARGEYDRAEELLQRAADIAAFNFGNSSDGEYRLRSLVGAAMLRQGRIGEAEPLLERSYEKLYTNTRVSTEYDRTLEELAGLRLSQGRLNEATSLYQRALQRYESFGVPNHPATADSLLGLAQIAVQTHRPEEAVSLSTQALANLRSELPEDHWKVALARARLSQSLLLAHRRP
jgi:tetratricopeptide (TPR) repeat protein